MIGSNFIKKQNLKIALNKIVDGGKRIKPV